MINPINQSQYSEGNQMNFKKIVDLNSRRKIFLKFILITEVLRGFNLQCYWLKALKRAL